MIFDNEVLYDDGKHKFIMLGTDISGEEGIPVNQFLVIDGNEAVLLDPGGAHVFATVLANVSEIIDPTLLTGLFYSHQDPDVTSGIMMWLNVSERAKVYVSELWIRFLPHFGVYDANRVIGIPDKGMDIRFSSGNVLHVIPAHYLHSPGMFTLYDPVSKILFSADIGPLYCRLERNLGKLKILNGTLRMPYQRRSTGGIWPLTWPVANGCLW